LYLRTTNSTNHQLKLMLRQQDLPEGFLLRADFQDAGRGQGANSWESEVGKNLLFSVLLRPEHIPIGRQFVISQLVSLSILRALQHFLPSEAEAFSIKWPNDIYWNDRKIGGILIENILQGSRITASILGVGLNVNQLIFRSDAPNPVSMRQISGYYHRRIPVLNAIQHFLFESYLAEDMSEVAAEYASHLYRRIGYHRFFSEEKGFFEAEIVRVEADGRLVVKEKTGQESGFYFKEIRFC
jgi:BirA family biotin operon repressor/biotin-[acetyl-CoA-carboxylase] ligase